MNVWRAECERQSDINADRRCLEDETGARKDRPRFNRRRKMKKNDMTWLG
jgi:hypothetical protein